MINYGCVSPIAMIGFTILKELLWLLSAGEEVLTSPITAIIVKSSGKIEVCYRGKIVIGITYLFELGACGVHGFSEFPCRYCLIFF
jgi:hypothetical protein